MVPEIFIQSEDELLNGVSPKPVVDDESKQEMNSVYVLWLMRLITSHV